MKNRPKYNPNIHHRRSIRLKGYDYGQAGLYFITICCQDRICRFGSVVNGKMKLNNCGMVAYNEWIKLSERFPNFELDVFQIMPNHMHGIILLNNIPLEAELITAQNDIEKTEKVAPTIGNIVGAYKSLVVKGCLEIYKSKNVTLGKLWQRNYYEHIIRNEKSYRNISQYIINNPAKWADDKFHK